MNWEDHAATWPHAQHSRFSLCKPHHWHIQSAGKGPLILLLHGAGGATQSWRHLLPVLAKQFSIVAIDLPGQGFTKLGAQQRCGLDAMAEDIALLCRAEAWQPSAIVGHSAGAAIALQLYQELREPSTKVVGINAALDTFNGLAGVLFPMIARALSMMPLVADIFSATSSRGNSVEKLIKGTGSTLSLQDLAFYRHLITDRSHVSATLQMMSQWDLKPLLAALPYISAGTLLIASDGDLTVPASVSRKAAERLPNGQFELIEGLGHLAHEEDAERVGALIIKFLQDSTK